MLRTLAIIVLMLAALALPTVGDAYLLTVNFTTDAQSGSASGSFSFDSSLIPSGGGFLENASTGLGLSSLSVSSAIWPISFDLSNAAAVDLVFDSSETLTGWRLGGFANGLLSYFGGSNDLLIDALHSPGIVYPPVGFTGAVVWSVTTSETGSAPEPGSLALVGSGLLAAGFALRRKRRG